MVKMAEREEAIRLRSKERMSVPAIAKMLNVQNNTVRGWVREYPLTEEELRERRSIGGLSKKGKPGKKKSREIENFVCRICRRMYSMDRDNRHGHTRIKCNSCNVNRRREMVKKKCVEYKGGRCSRCAYSKCLRSLVFHHLEPSDKEFQINAYNAALSWERTRKELDKCILLCANCHGEVHDELNS